MKINVWNTPVPDTIIKSVSGAVIYLYGDVQAPAIV